MKYHKWNSVKIKILNIKTPDSLKTVVGQRKVLNHKVGYTMVSLEIVGGRGSLGPMSSGRPWLALGLPLPSKPPHLRRLLPCLLELSLLRTDTDESAQQTCITW